jgi:hypothetical protein
MKPTVKMIAALACAFPLAALAQTSTTPPSADKDTGAKPPPGTQSKKTTETGQSTTYPQSATGSGMNKSAAQPTDAEKDKDKITRGDTKKSASPMTGADPSTTQKPAKEGTQSGPTK